MNLSKKHINYILGVSIPINESAYLSKDIKLNIIYEQILYETFLDSIKNYASEKYNQIVTNIKDWKDAAVVMGKVLSNANLLNDFLNPLQRQVENLFKPVTDFLKNKNLESWVEKIKEVFTKIKSLTGWKKFMSLVTLGSIITFITTKLTPEKIVGYLTKLFSSSSEMLTAITGKLIDFKSYIGWLQPIVGGVEVIYEFLKPLIEAFKTALESGNKFATKLIKENMKTQQLRKLIREIILSEVESTSTDKSTPPTNTKQLQGQINIELFKKLKIEDFDPSKFSTTINLVKDNKSLNMAANKVLADTMVALIKTDDDALLNQIFSNLKQVKSS